MKRNKRCRQALREVRKILNRGFSIESFPAPGGMVMPALAVDVERIGDAAEVLEGAGYSIPQASVVICNVLSETKASIEKRFDEVIAR